MDATGEPMNDENAPTTDFEKEAVQGDPRGQALRRAVVGEGEDRRLLAATVVPVVIKKCADCHTGTRRWARCSASSATTSR